MAAVSAMFVPATGALMARVSATVVVLEATALSVGPVIRMVWFSATVPVACCCVCP